MTNTKHLSATSRLLRLLAALLTLTLVAAACTRDDGDTATEADDDATTEESSSSDGDSGDDSDDSDDDSGAMDDDSGAMDDGDMAMVEEAKAFVAAQLAASEGFDGPASGPEAQADKTVIYVASDLTNGGVAAVDEAAAEAAAAIGWNYETINGQGTADGRAAALNQAVAKGPDGIILGGFNADEQQTAIAEAEAQGIPVVGWHAAKDVGPQDGLFNNVTTDPLEVSEFAAKLVIAESEGTAGVVIFTDSQFDIAIAKADAIQAEIETCGGCTVLEYIDTPILETDAQMPAVIARILAEYGDDLTHMLAINDGYFGGAAPALRDAGKAPDGSPFAISAGDGDAAAFDRIRNQEYQFGTVAEPLYLQGWQIIDELNRAFAGEGPSDFVAPPAMVTAENITDADVYDPASGYRDNYRAIWGV
jgi:ribose transport system substrate-binding protein